MFKMKSEHSYADIFEGMLIGGSLVAMTTFLLGTKKGKQIKKDLLDKYKELKDKAEDMQEKLYTATPSPKKVKTAVKKTVKKVLPRQIKAKSKSQAKTHHGRAR